MSTLRTQNIKAVSSKCHKIREQNNVKMMLYDAIYLSKKSTLARNRIKLQFLNRISSNRLANEYNQIGSNFNFESDNTTAGAAARVHLNEYTCKSREYTSNDD